MLSNSKPKGDLPFLPEVCPCRLCKIFLGQVGFMIFKKNWFLVTQNSMLSLLSCSTSALSFLTNI